MRPDDRILPGGDTGPGYDDLLDIIAKVCATDDVSAIEALYTNDELGLPAELVR